MCQELVQLISSAGYSPSARCAGLSSRRVLGLALSPTSICYRMVLTLTSIPSPSLLYTLASAALQHVPFLHSTSSTKTLARRETHDVKFIVFACLIPILVILSGVFAGLTLGYMSLDETQLNVLSISGTATQKRYANKIKPIRKNGHLLLVTLLLANMITNETLPVISAPVLGGGVQSVVVSTVLIVIFAEIIPQSLCTRYGLYFGAKMAGIVRVLIWTLGIVAWPVAKLLEFALGPHHGIIYRRAELKELIAMHSNVGELGGDLRTDTVTIIGGALDFQEKVVTQAMTPIKDVFMLSIDAKLDYKTLYKICETGHSRIPVYEEVEIPVSRLVSGKVFAEPGNTAAGPDNAFSTAPSEMRKVHKIIGILLVKQCVLLDPKDAVPVRDIPLNKVPFVPNNEPLLGILDKFQEGRSHIAIVSRFSVERAASVKQAVKRGLTQRLLGRVGMGDSDSGSDSSDSDDEEPQGSSSGCAPKKRGRKAGKRSAKGSAEDSSDNEETLRERSFDGTSERDNGSSTKTRGNGRGSTRGRSKRKTSRPTDLELGEVNAEAVRNSMIPRVVGFWGREQSTPADAVLTKEGAEEFLQSVDPAIMPLGIITLEDVLEELIGEEIYDEFDPQGHPDLSYAKTQVKAVKAGSLKRRRSDSQLDAPHLPSIAVNRLGVGIGPNSANIGAAIGRNSMDGSRLTPAPFIARPLAMPALKGINFKSLAFARSRSAPPTPRDEPQSKGESTPATVPEGILPNPSDVEAPAITISTSPTDATTISPEPADTFLTEGQHAAGPAPEGPAIARAKSPHSSPSASPGLAVAPAVSGALVPPRSPSPSLEHAILIERKRRAAAGPAGASQPKGARFKSSPLTGERAGVVVAERVRRNFGAMETADEGDETEEVRIMEKDKEGPDK
ncbi:DUF21-domain-containing protein [Amylocystis lapponica]|nr:DUF21-domain-containing protein [Amylocystis lapponica]